MEHRDIVSYDACSDVAYAKLPGARIVRSAPLEDDDHVILNENLDGTVVGLQLLDSSDLDQSSWREYYRNYGIPAVLFEAVADWLARRGRDAPWGGNRASA